MKALFALLTALSLSSVSQAATLELTVTGLPAGEGQVLVAAFDQAALWLRGKPLKGARLDANGKTELVYVFEDLPEGATLAFSVIHDRNGNGKLDMNAVGMPTEAFGFSNDAVGSFGPPNFEAAKVLVSGRMQLRINLQ